MGAPVGNCNAAKNKSACRARTGKYAKGWYKRTGSRMLLYSKQTYNQRIKKMEKHWDYSYDRYGNMTRIYIPSPSTHSKYRVKRSSLK